MAIKTQLMGALAVLIIAITIAPDHCVKGALIEANVNVSVTLQTSLLNIRNSGVAGVFYALNDLLTYAVLALQVELALVAQLLVSALGGLLGQVLALLGYVLAADCPQPTDCSQLKELAMQLGCEQNCPTPDCDQLDDLGCEPNCELLGCDQIAACAQENECPVIDGNKPFDVCLETDYTPDEMTKPNEDFEEEGGDTFTDLEESRPLNVIVIPDTGSDVDSLFYVLTNQMSADGDPIVIFSVGRTGGAQPMHFPFTRSGDLGGTGECQLTGTDMVGPYPVVNEGECDRESITS